MKMIELSPRRVAEMLVHLRWLYIAGQVVVACIVYYYLALDVPLSTMLLVSGIALLGNIIAWMRQRGRALASSHSEIALWLVFDLLILAILLFLAGGATNPLATLLLVPVAFAVVILSRLYRWAVVLVAMGCYSILMFWFRELPHFHHAKVSNFDLHVIGMWVNFIVSAIIFITFLSALSRELRAREQARKRDEEIITAGVIAAGAAHELATPLSTAIMLTEAMQAELDDPQLQQDMALLSAQHAACKQHLQRLLAVAGGQLNQSMPEQALTAALHEISQSWALTRPQIQLQFTAEHCPDNPVVSMPISLVQALLGLLNNAADASLQANSEYIFFHAEQQGNTLLIHIDDDGAGLSASQLANVGQVAFTSKDATGGLGLVLSHASVEQLGGRLTLQDREQAVGTRATISVPMEALCDF